MVRSPVRAPMNFIVSCKASAAPPIFRSNMAIIDMGTSKRGWRDSISACTSGMIVRMIATTATAGMIPDMAATSPAIRKTIAAITTMIMTMTITRP